jgi:hypothetical protein
MPGSAPSEEERHEEHGGDHPGGGQRLDEGDHLAAGMPSMSWATMQRFIRSASCAGAAHPQDLVTVT